MRYTRTVSSSVLLPSLASCPVFFFPLPLTTLTTATPTPVDCPTSTTTATVATPCHLAVLPAVARGTTETSADRSPRGRKVEVWHAAVEMAAAAAATAVEAVCRLCLNVWDCRGAASPAG